MSREPLLTTAALTALVAAGLRVLIEFGVPLTEGQTGALLDLITVLAPFAVWGIGRMYVTPLSDPRNNEGHSLVAETPHEHEQ